MSNQEQTPSMRLSVGNEEIDSTPRNTSLFTFVGKLSCYDHVFLTFGERDENGAVEAAYIWTHNPAFEGMRDFMFENGYPLHVNLQEIAQCDLDAYEKSIEYQTKDLDTIPEDWQ